MVIVQMNQEYVDDELVALHWPLESSADLVALNLASIVDKYFQRGYRFSRTSKIFRNGYVEEIMHATRVYEYLQSYTISHALKLHVGEPYCPRDSVDWNFWALPISGFFSFTYRARFSFFTDFEQKHLFATTFMSWNVIIVIPVS